MKRNRLKTILLTVFAVLTMSCSLSFASQAVVDQWSGSYSHQSRFDDCIVIDGIDVSEWQTNIDYNAVKAHGIDYVFIRVGTTATDIFKSVKDQQFDHHYTAAKAAGLMVGAYYYSAATTLEEAEAEARNVLLWLDGRHLDLPVVMDYERSERTVPAQIDMTANALRFLNYIEENSQYEVMFYSYRTLMDPYFADAVFAMDFINSKYPVWVAQYSTDINSYSLPFEFWQYTDSGQIPGISGGVDCNFWYYHPAGYPAAKGKTDIRLAQVSLSQSSFDYDGTAKTPAVTVTCQGSLLTEGIHYQRSYVKNVKAGTAYVLIKGIGAYDGYQTARFGIGTTVPNTAVSNLEKPAGVKATLRSAKTGGSDDVKITWNKVPGASSYKVYYKKTSSSSYKNYKRVSGSGAPSKILYGLAPGTKYQFKVVACSANGTTRSASIVSVTTLKKVVQNKVKKSGSSKVKISWSNISGETGYEISRSLKKDGTKVVATVKNASAKSKILKVPKKGKRYYYKVRAYKLVGKVRVCGPWSTVKSYKL